MQFKAKIFRVQFDHNGVQTGYIGVQFDKIGYIGVQSDQTGL